MSKRTEDVKSKFKALNPFYLIDLFNQDIEPVKIQGFGIYFKGQLVKPKKGKVIAYPSVNAAIDALKRNTSFHHKIHDELSLQVCGFNYQTDKKAWSDFFFNPCNPDGSSNGFKEENYEVYRAIQDTSRLALSKLIKVWLATGIIEIKPI